MILEANFRECYNYLSENSCLSHMNLLFFPLGAYENAIFSSSFNEEIPLSLNFKFFPARPHWNSVTINSLNKLTYVYKLYFLMFCFLKVRSLFWAFHKEHNLNYKTTGFTCRRMLFDNDSHMAKLCPGMREFSNWKYCHALASFELPFLYVSYVSFQGGTYVHCWNFQNHP